MAIHTKPVQNMTFRTDDKNHQVSLVTRNPGNHRCASCGSLLEPQQFIVIDGSIDHLACLKDDNERGSEVIKAQETIIRP